MFYLYKITNLINNKVYIGQSNKEKERWRQHIYYSKNTEKTRQYIHQAMNKYGVENFTYEVIAGCKDRESTDTIEALLIEQYKSRDKQFGYNIAPGGNSPWNRGLPTEQQPMYGKKQSEYFLKRMSEVHSGKAFVQTENTKKKISIAHLGKIHTSETKEKMSKSHSGKILNENTKIKISKSKLGLYHNEETKLKIGISNSIALKGKKHSEEHKKNNSLGHIGIHSGEKHPQSKLTNEQATNIRIEYQNKNITYQELALKYGVHKQAIARIIRNETYNF